MSAVSRYVPGPYQGVSQVPQQDRLEGTCEDMQDCLAVIPFGIQKRPPIEFLAEVLSADASEDAFIQEIPRGAPADDVTLIINTEGGSRIARLYNTLTMTAISLTVSAAAQTYLDLNTPTPKTDLRALTVEDVTFVTNRTVTVDKVSSTATARPFEGLIWVKVTGYSHRTTVTVTPSGGSAVTGSYSASTGGSASDAGGVGTDHYAQGLYDGTVPAGTGANVTGSPLNTLVSQGFTVSLTGALIYLSHPSADFTITIQDDIGGTGSVPIKSAVQRFSDLPALARDGFTVRIAQEGAGGNSDYYVEFQADSSTTGGVWKEVIAPGAPLGLDPLTMPVGIKDNAGTWELDTLPWKQRLTGTEALSPDPAFVGDQITAIKWLRGRLALIHNDGCALSASDDPYKFYTSTLAAQLDSDPVGLLPPDARKTYFKDGAVFERSLMLFADETQGLVTAADGTVKPTGTAILPIGNAPYVDACPVQTVPGKIHFLAPRSATKLLCYEFAVDRISGESLPDDLTPAVPDLLPSTIDTVATVASEYLSVYGESGGSKLYVHTFRFANNERVQNAWYTWNLPEGYTLCNMFFKRSTLYLFLKTTSGKLFACQMVLSPSSLDPSSTNVLQYLDLRVSEADASAVAYDAPSDTTTFILPVPVTADVKASVRAPGFGDYGEGYLPDIDSTTATTVVLKGDWSAAPLWFGYGFTSYFVPSRWYVLGRDEKVVLNGRLKIGAVRADVSRFSYLRMECSIKGRDLRTLEYQGYWTDDPTTPINTAPVSEPASLRMPVNALASDVSFKFINDTHLGFRLLGYEWSGDWSPRSNRIS